MMEAQREGASFRDPAGQVFQVRDRILRRVSERGAMDYEFVRDSGLLQKLVSEQRLVGAEEISRLEFGFDETSAKYLLEHPRLNFISYPYEWCFSALQAAALLQLDLLDEALAYDVTLSDASAFNIQFQGASPIFIDTLSFQRYQDGDYWKAHRQFCEQFLNPLLLSARKGIAFNAWFRGSLEGIRSEDLNRLLSWHQKLDWRVLTHVVLPVRFQASAHQMTEKRADRIKERRLPRSSFEHMIRSLRKWIASLKPIEVGSKTWRDYATDNSYDQAATEEKANFTRQFAVAAKPALLWDIGCNRGTFTEIALEAGAVSAIGFDTDLGAVEAAFARASRSGLHFLPLLMDVADPTPSQGWLNRERKSLESRAAADGLLALAIVHHLCIGRNIPLSEVVTWLIGLAPQGVIEFVEKEDPMVRFMLQMRLDIFDDYRRDAFLALVRKQADIVEMREINDNRRLLVWYRRRER